MSEGWSKDELRAAVRAYVEMQRKSRDGVPFIKKSYYDSLADRFGRTTKSFEYRMQNISYVLSLMGRQWLPGLKPARNVGANIAAEIETLINEAENRQALPVAAFEIAVKEAAKTAKLPKPPGNPKPKSTTASVTQYQRDPAVKAWVLQQAHGKCECCTQKAPFTGSDGEPFLEVHHVRQLADGGSDAVSNAVALCPNCHRELHYGENAAPLLDALYHKVGRLIRE